MALFHSKTRRHMIKKQMYANNILFSIHCFVWFVFGTYGLMCSNICEHYCFWSSHRSHHITETRNKTVCKLFIRCLAIENGILVQELEEITNSKLKSKTHTQLQES